VSAVAATASARSRSIGGAWAFLRRHVLTVYSILAFTYLMLPIGVVIAFSFNHPSDHFNYI